MQPMQHQQPSQESLSRPDSLILVGLVGGPKHAVALREATQQAEGVFIEPGTLYRILARLEVAFQCLAGFLALAPPLVWYVGHGPCTGFS